MAVGGRACGQLAAALIPGHHSVPAADRATCESDLPSWPQRMPRLESSEEKRIRRLTGSRSKPVQYRLKGACKPSTHSKEGRCLRGVHRSAECMFNCVLSESCGDKNQIRNYHSRRAFGGMCCQCATVTAAAAGMLHSSTRTVGESRGQIGSRPRCDPAQW